MAHSRPVADIVQAIVGSDDWTRDTTPNEKLNRPLDEHGRWTISDDRGWYATLTWSKYLDGTNQSRAMVRVRTSGIRAAGVDLFDAGEPIISGMLPPRAVRWLVKAL